MSQLLQELLAEKQTILADGAMGTGLFALGLETGGAPEIWNVEFPDRVASVHRGFVEAGCDLFLTNTFGCNRYRLKLHDAQDRVGELNQAAAALGREVAAEAGRPVVVAGDIGPTGEILAPIGPLEFDDAVEAFAEQAEALAEGGVDVLWIETLSAADEMKAAIQGAGRIGLPLVVTMTFDTNGRTMMGLTPEDAAGRAAAETPRPIGFGANCGIGPPQLLDSVMRLRSVAGPDDVIVAKGNCGIPRYEAGKLSYGGTPEVMADYAVLARDAGARIIGGCCGTSTEHLRAMAEALATRPPGPVPDYPAIEAALGPVIPASRPTTSIDPAASPRRTKRRRRTQE